MILASVGIVLVIIGFGLLFKVVTDIDESD